MSSCRSRNYVHKTNSHIENGAHLFIGPSYICFNTETIQNLNESAWVANKRSDVSEEITWVKPDLIDQNLFRPLKTLSKPIWALERKKKVYGLGTTFGYKNLPVNYHHFYSRNFIARLHFFLISFLKYIKIKLSCRNSQKTNLKLELKGFLSEIIFAIKYILGKIS